MIDSINQVLADFLESHRPKLREELLSEAPLRNPREAPALLDDWFNNEMERLRGRPAHTSEWIASFVMSERSGGAMACDIIAVVRYTREKIIEYCLSQFENVPAKLLYDAILNAETHYVDQIVRLCSEMDRQVLAAERRLQRAMAESMEQAFVLLDNGGNISFVNSPFADLVGIPEESLRGSEFAILCHPATATEIRRDLRQKRTTGARVFDGTLLDAKEATLPASFSVLPVYDDRGLRNGVAVAIRTRRAAMGNPVFTPEAIGGIADMLGMSVIVLNAQNRVTYVNASARALLDMDEKAAPQVAPEFCCTEHGADTGTCGACIARGVFAQGNTYHATVCVEDAAGGPRWLELACAAVRGPKGEISHIVRTLRNVTQQKTLENQILRQQRSSLVSQLGVTVAHQLRNPLGVMIGYAEMIHRGIPGDQVPEAVERILRNGIRCKEIVEELLEFGQGLPSEQAPCDINRLIVEKVQPMYPLSMANRITWRLQEGLPEVECVAQQIAQVFVNLIDNALWAARQSVEVRTVLQTDASGLPKYQGSGRTSMPAVCAYVTDDGPGVPEEHRRQIFDPFYTTRKDEGGIGLGLSLSRSVVQQHGGRLFLDET
ncbi:MAG: Hybrid sensor histidine kinase/response regulator, partial [Candidatus Hydrogenedentes bacterium]|nr:Hybrid sensor histidine kinase/response regulator [Candidatus Hydrogenedentota bacterium]